MILSCRAQNLKDKNLKFNLKVFLKYKLYLDKGFYTRRALKEVYKTKNYEIL